MAFQLSVRASIVDITTDHVEASDRFLVDTNVWYWQTYTKASQATAGPQPYQTTVYPQYLRSALDAGATLHRCGLALGELAHVIERTEKDLYEQSHGPIELKPFRHAPTQRKQVVKEIRSAWIQVENMTSCCDAIVNDALIKKTIECLSACQVDGYDALVVESALASGLGQVLTDDGDFCSVPGITVFTANRTVIREARKAGRLQARR